MQNYDKIATAFATKTINNHISIPPFAIYLHSEYIHHRIDKTIWSRRNEKETRRFLRTNCKWKLTIFNNIAWTEMLSSLGKQSFYIKINIRKFIHHRLASSKMNFAFQHECPYCKQTSTNQTEHDNFLTYSKTTLIKLRKQGRIKKLLYKWHTPLILRDVLLGTTGNN